MLTAEFKTGRTRTALPVQRQIVLETMRQSGWDTRRILSGMNNIYRGIPTIVGNCVVRKKAN